MATRRLKEFLDGSDVRYVIVQHSAAYTASEVAASVHIPGKGLAKVIVVVLEDGHDDDDDADDGAEHLALAVVPATKDVDFDQLRDAAGARSARIAEEYEFADRFEGCQVGTVPPFGKLFGVETYVDRELLEGSTIAFNAGTHIDVAVMTLADYLRLARPSVGDIAAPPLQLKLYATMMTT
jgi:Ala-tRNA(Pro) deacylase